MEARDLLRDFMRRKALLQGLESGSECRHFRSWATERSKSLTVK